MTNEEYEAKRAAEQAAERKATAEFHAKVKAVAPLIGGTYVANIGEEGYCAHVALVRLPFGGIVHFSRDWRGTDKCSVSGEWPRTAKGEVQAPYFSAHSQNGPKSPDIGISISRPAETLAKDILRRFIPAYQALYAAQVERVNSANDYAAKTATNKARLEKAFGELDSVGFEASGDSIRLKLSVTIEQAEQIAKLVKTFK